MPQDVHIDQDTLRELRGVLGGDFSVLVSTYLDDSGKRLAMLRDALAAADGVALRETAHSLKGSSLNIGATRLAGLCLTVEQAARAGALQGAAAQVEAIAAEFRLVSELLTAAR